MLMFPPALTADDVCRVYWQRMFSESVNDLQYSSLKKKRFMCAFDVCDVCVWAAVGGGVQCVPIVDVT